MLYFYSNLVGTPKRSRARGTNLTVQLMLRIRSANLKKVIAEFSSL